MRITERIGWGAMTFLCLGVAGYALFHVATGFAHMGSELLGHHIFSPYGLQVHIAASAFAVMLGPFQFLKSIRAKAPGVHRWIGRFYIAACFIGGLAGGAIALFSFAGPIAGVGFFLLAIGWLYTTSRALAAILKRDFVAHERWMVRSFALTLAAVTLRIYLPIAGIVSPDDFVGPYRLIAWLAWVPNVLIAEAWLAQRGPRASGGSASLSHA